MTFVIHTDRRRAGSFGDHAEQYDRARPSYPAELVDDLVGPDVRRVLDVGCGTESPPGCSPPGDVLSSASSRTLVWPLWRDATASMSPWSPSKPGRRRRSRSIW
jgi:hypothetical protein